MPVVFVQLGTMAMGVVDTIMVGRVSATALAAVALGNLYFFCLAVFGMGILMALDPLVSQAAGAGDDPAVARHLQRGLLLAVVLSVPVSLALVPAPWVLAALGQPPQVVPDAAAYARASIPGVFPFLAFVALRQTLQALHITRPIVWTIVGANLLNAGLNWILIFGKLGLPAMGAVGSAWASTISRCLMALGLLGLAWGYLRQYLTPLRYEAVRGAALMRMARLGWPIGVQYLLEIGAFAIIGLLMGWMGAPEMAGHQVAINLASLTFMVPLGVSAAAAVRVGQAVGRSDAPAARRAAAASLVCGVAFMLLCTAVFLSVPRGLARVYTGDEEVLDIARRLIPIAGVFQVFDGLQVVAIGILRGIGDTRAPMIVNVLGFWLVGMPVSVFLAFHTGTGPVGLWWGLVVGLAAVALFLTARVRFRLRLDLPRLETEIPPQIEERPA